MRRALAVAVLGLGLSITRADVALARIKLITLPVRERVEIQLDNPNATLVEEERIVPLVKGVNQVDFSWANTQIDPNTIVFRVIPRVEPAGEASKPKEPAKPLDVKVLSVSYPPNEAALVWQVASSDSGSARVRISYLLGNLTKSFNYRAVAVQRREDADALASTCASRTSPTRSSARPGSGPASARGSSSRSASTRPRRCWSRSSPRCRSRRPTPATRRQFGYLDRPQNKLLVPMHYVLKNDKANQLGRAPLQYGKVRIFQEDGRGGTAFLGEDWGKFTPLDDEMRLYVGVAQDVVVKRTIDKNEQKRVAGNLYNREVVVKYEIENFKDKAVTLDVSENVRAIAQRGVRRHGPRRAVGTGQGDDASRAGRTRRRAPSSRSLFHVELPARGADGKAEKIVHKLHLLIKNEW